MSSLGLTYVMRLLARREYSEFEIRCKMQEKGFSETEISQTIEYCHQKNWQNDRRFTESYLYSRSQKGYGVNRIRQELYHLKGISFELFEEVLAEVDINWSEVALSVLRKKFPNYAAMCDGKTRQKIWHYMLSHGFISDDFSDYVNQYPPDFI